MLEINLCNSEYFISESKQLNTPQKEWWNASAVETQGKSLNLLKMPSLSFFLIRSSRKQKTTFYSLYIKLIETKQNDFCLLKDISLYLVDLIWFICGPEKCGLILWVQDRDSMLNNPGSVRSSFIVKIWAFSEHKNVEFQWLSLNILEQTQALWLMG